MPKIMNVVNHPIDLDSGRSLAPGEEAEVDLDHAHNKSLVDEGLAVEIKVEKQKAPATTGEDKK